MLLPTDLLGNVITSETGFTLSTGSYDRAASSLGSFAMNDREFLKRYGTEGSAATIGNLSRGSYSFDWSMYSKDTNGWDKLYAWNGKDLILVGDRESGNQISPARWTHDSTMATVDVIYDYITFIALDENDKTGVTQFTINNFEYLEELPYDAPVSIGLNPDYLLGDIDIKDDYTSIGTGTGDRAISTLSQELGIDLSDMGTEGSIASWNLENGVYELTWKIYRTEDQRDRDKVYLWDGEELQFFADGLDAVQTSATRYQTDWVTTEVEVTNGELTFVALDEVDKVGTTQLRIQSLERIGSLVPEEISFDPVPEDGMGSIVGSTLSNGEGAVSAETLTSDFFHNSVDISLYGTEGTAALWVTEPGIQQITWSVTTEDDLAPDQFLLWDGEKLSRLGDTYTTKTIFDPENWNYNSELITTTVETVSDEWGIVVLDAMDSWMDTAITIHEIKWLSEGEADPLPEPYMEGFSWDIDVEPSIIGQEQALHKIGLYYDDVYGQVLDEYDGFEIPLGYNEGVEGTISVVSGPDLTVDIYNFGSLYESYTVGSEPLNLNFQSELHFINIYTTNASFPTEYALDLNIGQVYDPF